MRANRINIYDLDAVNTTIVMRELPYNPDVQEICIYALDPVLTTIVMYPIPCVVSAATSFFGILKYWTGAIWERGLLKVFNGTIWEPATLKWFDGTSFKEIDATG